MFGSGPASEGFFFWWMKTAQDGLLVGRPQLSGAARGREENYEETLCSAVPSEEDSCLNNNQPVPRDRPREG